MLLALRGGVLRLQCTQSVRQGAGGLRGEGGARPIDVAVYTVPQGEAIDRWREGEFVGRRRQLCNAGGGRVEDHSDSARVTGDAGLLR